MQLLGGLSPARFLRDYWQKQPLLIRRAMPAWRDPISPEELAGLACEPGVEARLVLERGGDRPWRVRHGPFSEADFAALPETHWTLLVQDAEKQAPALLGDFLEPFRFIPDWRCDDLMISYAAPHGSVGPHWDEYDVFLLQGQGRRRWGVSARPVDPDAILPDLELRLLSDFTPEQEWLLEPGDMLYLPPRVAHHGVAVEPCLTYSIGLRAPAERELLMGFMELLVETADPAARYADPELELQDNPGEITPATLARIDALLRRLTAFDETLVARWFGRFITEPKEGFAAEPEAEPWTLTELQDYLRGGGTLERHPGSRFAFIKQGANALLFIDGQEFELGPAAASLAPPLCRRRTLTAGLLRQALREEAAGALLLDLVNEGYLASYADD